MKEETALYILESGKSITKAAKELGLNINTACRWVNDYKKRHGIIDDNNKPATSEELQKKIKELEKQLKEKDKKINEQKKSLEIEDFRRDMFKYIELFYNRKRRHSYLGYVSPIKYRNEYERRNVA